MIELLKEKKYELLSEGSYFINNDYKKTKEVNLLALKFGDSDKLLDLLTVGKRIDALRFLCEKGYITPVEGGKLKIDELDFRASVVLLEEYSSSFLDISPFLPTKEKGESSENQFSAS
jgi:hypothetical protein